MKTYIWGLPTRAFHFLLVIGLIAAYTLGQTEYSLNLHTAFGYFVGILILFRIIWGVVGPKYSRFTDFPIRPKSLIAFFKSMTDPDKQYIGHNPLASVVMLGIIIMTLATVFTGMMTFSSFGYGFIKNLNFGIDPEKMKEIHEISINIFAKLFCD